MRFFWFERSTDPQGFTSSLWRWVAKGPFRFDTTIFGAKRLLEWSHSKGPVSRSVEWMNLMRPPKEFVGLSLRLHPSKIRQTHLLFLLSASLRLHPNEFGFRKGKHVYLVSQTGTYTSVDATWTCTFDWKRCWNRTERCLTKNRTSSIRSDLWWDN